MAREVKINPLDLQTDVGIGISYPISSKTGLPAGRTFVINYTSLNQAKSNLIMLLLTNYGERIMHYDFGCDFKKDLFEPLTTSLIIKIENKIRTAVKKWLPYIIINTLEITPDLDNKQISINILFNLEYNKFSTESIIVTLPLPS